MDPFTIMAITMAALGSWMAVDSHQQQKANARSQERLEQYNAQVAAGEAERAEQEARSNALRQQEEDRRFRAHQRALYGASGAALASGSPLAVLGQTAADEQLKVDDVMRGGALDYRRGEMERQNDLYRAKVAAGSKPSALSLAGSLMSVAGSSMQMYAMGSGDRLASSQAPKKTGGGSFGVGVSSRTAMGSRATMTQPLY